MKNMFKLADKLDFKYKLSSLASTMSQQEAKQILGISGEYNPQNLKMIYRQLALQYHPDINNTPEAESTFKKINLAYETLKNEVSPLNEDEVEVVFAPSYQSEQSDKDERVGLDTEESGSNIADIGSAYLAQIRDLLDKHKIKVHENTKVYARDYASTDAKIAEFYEFTTKKILGIEQVIALCNEAMTKISPNDNSKPALYIPQILQSMHRQLKGLTQERNVHKKKALIIIEKLRKEKVQQMLKERGFR